MSKEIQTSWNSRPYRHRVGARRIDVWRCRLNISDGRLSALLALLSPDELIRAGRYVFEPDRTRFVVGRSFLRLLLGRYVQRPPRSIRFTYRADGKPELAENPVDGPLGFNLAHAGEWAVCAIAPTKQLGIDIECARGGIDFIDIANSFFSIGEAQALRSLPECDRASSFLACWTRKEAYLKSTGEGLSASLAEFEVSLGPSEQARIVSIAGSKDRSRGWFMEDFSPARGYAGALVVPGGGWDVVYHDFAFLSHSVAAASPVGA